MAVGSGYDDAVENTPVLSSSDGTNWTSHYSGTTGDLYGITHGRGFFEAVGDFVLQSQPVLELGPPGWMPNGSIEIKIRGEAGVTNTIQASTDLSTWTDLTNVVFTNTTWWLVDPFATNYNQRFYRTSVSQ